MGREGIFTTALLLLYCTFIVTIASVFLRLAQYKCCAAALTKYRCAEINALKSNRRRPPVKPFAQVKKDV